jgi:hypothetical protein
VIETLHCYKLSNTLLCTALKVEKSKIRLTASAEFRKKVSNSRGGATLLTEEELPEREWGAEGIVVATGDRGAMKQMQSHGIPLKPTTALRK